MHQNVSESGKVSSSYCFDDLLSGDFDALNAVTGCQLIWIWVFVFLKVGTDAGVTVLTRLQRYKVPGKASKMPLLTMWDRSQEIFFFFKSEPVIHSKTLFLLFWMNKKEMNSRDSVACHDQTVIPSWVFVEQAHAAL